MAGDIFNAAIGLAFELPLFFLVVVVFRVAVGLRYEVCFFAEHVLLDRAVLVVLSATLLVAVLDEDSGFAARFAGTALASSALSSCHSPHTRQQLKMQKHKTTRMWVNAQRDGRAAEHR